MIGLGYIGLPTAVMFATSGAKVHGVDINKRVVASVNSGSSHLKEPNLELLLRKSVESGCFVASTQPTPADAFIMAVQTPMTPDKRPDLSHVESAARLLAEVLKPGDLVVLESTVPVGTTEKLSELLTEHRPDLTFPHQEGEASDIRIAHCPERVLPGRILHEVVENDRLIGGLTSKCSEHAFAMYKTFVRGKCHLTNARTAELAKLAENAYRDVNIAFANELSLICERLHIDVWDLIRLANQHPRVNILKPGPGVGGHCIAIDPWFIVSADPADAKLIRQAREINDAKPLRVVETVVAHASKLKRPSIACLGLAYKADVDDVRESPAVEVVHRLAAIDVGELLIVEPHIGTLPPPLAGLGIDLWSLDDALARADIVLLLVDHTAFSEVNRPELKNKVVIDTRGAWRAREGKALDVGLR